MFNINYKRKINWLVDHIIETSMENTAGLPMTRPDIHQMVIEVETFTGAGWDPDKEMIDALMDEYSNEEGFLIKASDVVEAFRTYEKIN